MSKPIQRRPPGSEPQTVEGHPTHEEIKLRAHQIFVERGCADGLDAEDWLQAERELREKYGKAGLQTKVVGVQI